MERIRRDENDTRGSRAIVLLLESILYQRFIFSFEPSKAIEAQEVLIRPEGHEQDVRSDIIEPLIGAFTVPLTATFLEERFWDKSFRTFKGKVHIARSGRVRAEGRSVAFVR